MATHGARSIPQGPAAQSINAGMADLADAIPNSGHVFRVACVAGALAYGTASDTRWRGIVRVDRNRITDRYGAAVGDWSHISNTTTYLLRSVLVRRCHTADLGDSQTGHAGR